MKASAEAIKKMATKITKKPGTAVEIGAKSGGAPASKSLKAALSEISVVLNFYHTKKGLYL